MNGSTHVFKKKKQHCKGAAMHRSRLLPFILLSLSLCATTTNGDDPIKMDCPTNTNYTRGSAYDANLDALLSSLPAAAAASSGFAKNTTGATPDQAFGLAQCRADIVNASDCRACLDAAVRNVTSRCPGQKTALIIYDLCLLRYSSMTFFGSADTSWWRYICNRQNAQPVLFMPRLATLMNNLTGEAANGPRMFAAAAVEVTPYVRLYGMVQCTRDLAAADCMTCLSDAVDTITKKCDGKEGGRMYHRSCSLRYEVYPFYDDKSVEVAMSPASGSGAGLNNGSNLTNARSTDAAAGSGRNRTVRTALLVSITVVVTLLVLLSLLVHICKKRKPHEHVKVATNRHENEEMESLEHLQYPLSTLIAATDNFSEQNRLGQGAFGPVYRGKLHNGQEIAVKRLSTTSQQGQAEMKNEVALVAKLQHKNLVRLLGYCIEKTESLLVYEFLSNKSLDNILYGPASQCDLSWEQRYKIIYGISRGLMYLHEDSRLTVIHRDLKPGNILLDGDMNPKISDFGLAKLFHIDLSVANTCHVAGTRGYMAPEYILNGIFSAKSDVFSYGVLLLEVVTGRRPSDDLLKFVWRHWSQGNLPPLLDSCPTDESGQQQMLRCIHIGLLCVQDDPELRPRMAAVVLMLNSHSMTLAMPTEPIFAATGDRPRAVDPEPSINEASVSYMEPR